MSSWKLKEKDVPEPIYGSETLCANRSPQIPPAKPPMKGGR